MIRMNEREVRASATIRTLDRAAEEFRSCDEELRGAYLSGDRAAINAARVAVHGAIAWYLKAEVDCFTAI